MPERKEFVWSEQDLEFATMLSDPGTEGRVAAFGGIFACS